MRKKAQVAIIEILIILQIGIAILGLMTFSYKKLANNLWEDLSDKNFDMIANYIDSCFCTIMAQNKNANYAPTLSKLDVELPNTREISYSVKGMTNEVIIKNSVGKTKILIYPDNYVISGIAFDSQKTTTLVHYINNTKNIIEITKSE